MTPTDPHSATYVMRRIRSQERCPRHWDAMEVTELPTWTGCCLVQRGDEADELHEAAHWCLSYHRAFPNWGLGADPVGGCDTPTLEEQGLYEDPTEEPSVLMLTLLLLVVAQPTHQRRGMALRCYLNRYGFDIERRRRDERGFSTEDTGTIPYILLTDVASYLAALLDRIDWAFHAPTDWRWQEAVGIYEKPSVRIYNGKCFAYVESYDVPNTLCIPQSNLASDQKAMILEVLEEMGRICTNTPIALGADYEVAGIVNPTGEHLAQVVTGTWVQATGEPVGIRERIHAALLWCLAATIATMPIP